MQAAGSLWNPNSWHWEMKNCSERSRVLLEERLLSESIKGEQGAILRHTKATFPKADAEINIRKGKPIYVFEFEIELTLQCEYNDCSSEGSYRAKEILNDSLEDIIIDDIKAKDKNQAGDQLKKWVKHQAKRYLASIVLQLQRQLLAHESDPSKIQANKKLREANLEAVVRAKEEKGAQKERLLLEQKQKEKQMKIQAEIKDLQMHQAKMQTKEEP